MPPRYDIIFTPTATKDLLEIQDYYIYTLDDIYLSEKVTNGIISKIYSLRIFPESSTPVTHKNGVTIRMTHWKQFNIYFSCDRKSLKVCILYIINAHRRYRPF